jgi:phenylacetate-CoA ligase
VRSELWELIWSAFTVRDHLWHRRDFAGTLGAIRESGAGTAPWPEGSVSASWGYSTEAVFRTGPAVRLNILTPVEQQVEWLLRRDPDYLVTHPSIAEMLARACLERGVRPARLRQVITIAERLRPGVREACRVAFGVSVADLYSTREAGYLALQCPEHEHYHVQSEGVFLEVLDERGAPCGPGEVGRVVVTPLHNLAMPLIRYDIGDLAEVGAPCACGRGLPVLMRVVGRVQAMLRLRDGSRRWTLLSSGDLAALLEAAPVRQYQVAQVALDRIELRVVAARALAPAEEEALAAWVRRKFGAEFGVVVRCVPALQRTAAGKLEDFVCEV